VKNKKNIPGFKTPKDYFETFDERLFNKMNEEEFPLEQGFIVPDGYFKELEGSILQKVSVSESQTKVIPLFKRQTLLIVASVAACVAILFSVVKINIDVPFDFEAIELSNIDGYIDDGNLELNSYELMAMLEDDEVTNISTENDFILEENLEEYLLDNINDNTLLIE